MSLEIYGQKSRFKYHSGYSGLHRIRYLSYLICGGKKEFIYYMHPHFLQKNESNKSDDDDNKIYLALEHFDWAFVKAWCRFPNLNQHSDCDGSYTADGKIDIKWTKQPKTPMSSGNSIELLKELETIKRFRKALQSQEWETFDMLYRLVKSEVSKGGKLFFE